MVIISCVRSSKRFLKEDSGKGVGLIFEKKRYQLLFPSLCTNSKKRFSRMNVAITRAKELLVVIGNGSVLKQDPYWKGFLHFTIRNKLCDIFLIVSVGAKLHTNPDTLALNWIWSWTATISHGWSKS